MPFTALHWLSNWLYTRIYYFLNIFYTKVYLVSLTSILNSSRVKFPCFAHLLPPEYSKEPTCEKSLNSRLKSLGSILRTLGSHWRFLSCWLTPQKQWLRIWFSENVLAEKQKMWFCVFLPLEVSGSYTNSKNMWWIKWNLFVNRAECLSLCRGNIILFQEIAQPSFPGTHSHPHSGPPRCVPHISTFGKAVVLGSTMAIFKIFLESLHFLTLFSSLGVAFLWNVW